MSSISSAIEQRQTGAAAMVGQYQADFAAILPSHVRPETFVRLATGVLRRDPRLAQAANNDIGLFFGALLHAARLGLEPGSEQFYLTPRRTKLRDGSYKETVLGIVGWQGYVELIYRAGAVSSVVAECVYSNDKFTYRPGLDTRPVHEIDWDSDDRGTLRLVYSYAVMKDGATSKVIVLNKGDIARIKQSAQGADKPDSPWVKHEPQMWLKSAVRQLQKWVPTSPEYRDQMSKSYLAAAESPIPAAAPPAAIEPEPAVDTETGEVLDAEFVDPAEEQARYEASLA